MEVRFTQLLVIAIFEHRHSQGSVATHLKSEGMFNYCFAETYC